ncbi:hypothetical protein ACET3Z_030851 [Daucus carota]
MTIDIQATGDSLFDRQLGDTCRASMKPANNETPDDNNIVESPVRPKGTKATKRKGKGKKKVIDVDAERYEEMTSVQCRKLSLLEEFNKNHVKEMNLKIIMADTSIMTEAQREVHAKLVEEIRRRN